jgi:hypothetical protein
MSAGRKFATTHHCPKSFKGNCRFSKVVGQGNRYCTAHLCVCPNCPTKIPFIKDNQRCPNDCGYYHPDNLRAKKEYQEAERNSKKDEKKNQLRAAKDAKVAKDREASARLLAQKAKGKK